MELSRGRPVETRGLLYPLMLIAAIAVIVFSLVGIATMAGWMPNAMAGKAPEHNYADTAYSGVTFECAECGVIQSIREIERRDTEGARRGDTLALKDV